MTKKKFANVLLEAICTYGALAEKSQLKDAQKFKGIKAGLFYGVDEDGRSETDHYILVELVDGTFWRVLPGRALKLEEHEQQVWDEFKRLKESGEFDDNDEPPLLLDEEDGDA